MKVFNFIAFSTLSVMALKAPNAAANMTVLTNKQNGKGYKRILKATFCSFNGFNAAYKHESAFRQELLLAIVLMPFSFYLAESAQHWFLLCGAVLFVLFAEILNSAIEAIADSVTLDHHILIGRAKDMGSSAVFIALLFLVLVWGHAILSVVMNFIASAGL